MLIDRYVAEQMKKAMLNSEQEQVKIYDAYYNKGVTDGYNKALEDCRKMCDADTPRYTNCIGCPLARFENDFDTTICKIEQLKK